jgi:cytoskeletal protein RodZ
VITEGKTIGEILRAAREEKRLSVEQVNRETKISTQTISALEADDFEGFPSETYLKGFLRTYADFLGLDGGKLWSMMRARSSPAGGGAGPSWEIEQAVREEKLGPPRVIRTLAVPLMIVAIVVLTLLLLCDRGNAGPFARGPAGSGYVEEIRITG